MPDQPTPPNPSVSDAPVTDWQTQANEYLAGWQRAQADFANFKKRMEEDRQAFIKFSQSDLLLQLLPILDNFKRATVATPNESNWSNWANGIKAIESQFESILQSSGIAEMQTNVGDAFDPNFHDAISTEVGDQPADHILAIVEPGYLLYDKVLRPTKVKVSSGKPQN